MCVRAALSGQLNDYVGAGQCVVKQYVQYTHLCTVSDYLPSVDHCCCPVSDDRLLCCRYHQDWYHFRCTENDDAIELRYVRQIERQQVRFLEIICFFFL